MSSVFLGDHERECFSARRRERLLYAWTDSYPDHIALSNPDHIAPNTGHTCANDTQTNLPSLLSSLPSTNFPAFAPTHCDSDANSDPTAHDSSHEPAHAAPHVAAHPPTLSTSHRSSDQITHATADAAAHATLSRR